MEKRYENGIDTWGNRERKLYQKIFKTTVLRVLERLKGELNSVAWFDVGCGGGNIWDTVIENTPEGFPVYLRGCDLSKVAVDDLCKRYTTATCYQIDLETYMQGNPSNFYHYLRDSNVVSIVDVAYYFGDKRPWKETMDEIWKSIAPGTIVVVADSLIPYQRRSYFGTKSDCETLASYTDWSEPVSEEVRADGTKWHRYFKVKIYRKLVN